MSATAKLSVIATETPAARTQQAMIEVEGLHKLYRTREGRDIEAL